MASSKTKILFETITQQKKSQIRVFISIRAHVLLYEANRLVKISRT